MRVRRHRIQMRVIKLDVVCEIARSFVHEIEEGDQKSEAKRLIPERPAEERGQQRKDRKKAEEVRVSSKGSEHDELDETRQG